MANNSSHQQNNNNKHNNNSKADEEGGPSSQLVQPGVGQKNLVPSRVHLLDRTERTFHIHRKAKGSVLINMVAAHLDLKEKDYFGLAYYNEQKMQHWLYPDKRIKKQLKGGLQWEFWFQVKFYAPNPSQLTEDLTRYLLYLQLRRDVHTERLPVSFAAQANLGSLVAQATLGDYQPNEDYARHLQSAEIAQPTSEQEQFISHVRELHKNHRGLTSEEAELSYLNECKVLAMYGVHLFPAKDNKGKPVQLGVSAHGIDVYSDQMRMHRFTWPNIIKFSYRRHHFSIKLVKGGVDPKKDTTVTYNMASYEHAKLLWKCAVEHHTFFRLVQPDSKAKGSSLFSFGSTRFRYTGRTNIQSQMASQLFEAPPIGADRSKFKSADQIAQKGPMEHSSPLNYADEVKPSPGQQQQQHATIVHYQEQLGDNHNKGTKSKKKENKKASKKLKKEGKPKAKAGSALSSSSTSSSSSDEETEEIHVLVHEEKAQKMPEKFTENLTHKARDLDTVPLGADGNGLQHEEGNNTNAVPHTSTRTWHEEHSGPEQVTTEVDEHGNVIKRTVRTEHVRHTVQQTQSYQTVAVDDDNNTANNNTSMPSSAPVPSQRGAAQNASGTYYENGNGPPTLEDGNAGELVSSKLVTTGNRTIETLTYKKENDGAVETRVEHRITIHSNEDIDHDAELNRAILEATNMNPNMKVEKVDVERSTTK